MKQNRIPLTPVLNMDILYIAMQRMLHPHPYVHSMMGVGFHKQYGNT